MWLMVPHPFSENASGFEGSLGFELARQEWGVLQRDDIEIWGSVGFRV